MSPGELINFENIRNITGVFTAGTLIMSSIKKVPKNHRGFRTIRENPERTRGRKQGERYRSVGSGFHIVRPFIGDVKSTSVQKRTDDIPAFKVETPSGKYEGDAVIDWRVDGATGIGERKAERCKDDALYKALFTAREGNLDNFVRNMAREAITASCSKLGKEEVMTPGRVYEDVLGLKQTEFDEFGVVLDAVRITAYSRSEAQTFAEELSKDHGPQGTTGLAAAAQIFLLPKPEG